MPDARWNDPREYDDRDRGDSRRRIYGERDQDDHDPRDSLIHHLDLPRGEERELVVDRDRVYELNAADSRTLAAVGTFRVVPEQDLDTNHDAVRHLRDERLVETVNLGGDERGLTLTKEGRDLLDSHSLERDGETGHGDRDVSCDADGKGDSPADRHAWLVEARHETDRRRGCCLSRSSGYLRPQCHASRASDGIVRTEDAHVRSPPLTASGNKNQTRALRFPSA